MQATFPDCFNSWPVQMGSSCTSGAAPSPSPTTQATTRAPATTTQATTTTTTTTTRVTATMPTVPPTSTKQPTSTQGPTSCAAAGDDCRDAGCCQQAGHTCYEKAMAKGSCIRSVITCMTCTASHLPINPSTTKPKKKTQNTQSRLWKDDFWAACRSSCEPGSVNPTDPEEPRKGSESQVVHDSNHYMNDFEHDHHQPRMQA